MKYKTMTHQRKLTEEITEKLGFFVKSKIDTSFARFTKNKTEKVQINSIKNHKDSNALFAPQIKKLM